MELLEQFRQYLKDKQVSPNTRKNYVSDLSTFVDFLKSINQYFSILTLPFILDDKTLTSYKTWLEKKDPVSTANRRLSSLRKFITFAIETNAISQDYTGTVSNIISLMPKKGEQTLEMVEQILRTDVSDAKAVEEYTSDVKEYLESKSDTTPLTLPIDQRPFSIKKFWQWKNAQPATKFTSEDISISFKSEPVNRSKLSSSLVLTFAGICISLSLITLIFVTSEYLTTQGNGRPSDAGEFVFLQSIYKKLPFGNTGSSNLIDPTTAKVVKSQNFELAKFKRTWSIFSSWISGPTLVDPSL